MKAYKGPVLIKKYLIPISTEAAQS